MPAQTLARANKYPARCIRCNGRIAAGDGLLARTDDGRWAADHPEACPTPAPAAVVVERVARDGIYRTDDGTIYKVQEARQGTGRLYAKRLHFTTCMQGTDCPHPTIVDEGGNHRHGHFTYEAGAVHTLRADQRLADTDAAAYGKLYGICICCGADLTDEKSIKVGIGPICRGKYF